jgi:pimeloyl-ACP methyl ester carboxylesterase
MLPFYFRQSHKPLFGIYHAPEGRQDRDSGVIVCYPMGSEYIRSHRAFRQLAARLAANGFHVLRFDYYGCGDSAGEGHEGHPGQWMDDIATAIEEIKVTTGVGSVFLVGARFGATLAAIVGAQRSDLGGVVLWEPVLNGASYIRELLNSHESWVMDKVPSQKRNRENGYRETLGFPLPESIRTGVANIDLLALTQYFTKRVLVIEHSEIAAMAPLKKNLESLRVNIDYQHIPDAPVWGREATFDGLFVPAQTLQAIMTWITRVSL